MSRIIIPKNILIFKVFPHIIKSMITIKLLGLVYPIVRMIKKIITTQNPIKDVSYKDTANGNKNNTSKSKIINKIATR